MKQKKIYFKLLILLLSIIIIISLMILIFCKSYSNLINLNTNLKPTNTSEELIKPNLTLQFNTHYLTCNHTITSSTCTNKYLNCTLNDIKKDFPDWKIISYKNNILQLLKEEHKFCNEHYLLKNNNSYIYVYQLDENNNIINNYNTSISINFLSSDDKKNLNNGIYIYR